MMGSNHHPFVFDANWGFGDDSLLSDSNNNGTAVGPIPPILGYFLELAGPPLLLLNGQNLDLL